MSPDSIFQEKAKIVRAGGHSPNFTWQRCLLGTMIMYRLYLFLISSMADWPSGAWKVLPIKQEQARKLREMDFELEKLRWEVAVDPLKCNCVWLVTHFLFSLGRYFLANGRSTHEETARRRRKIRTSTVFHSEKTRKQ